MKLLPQADAIEQSNDAGFLVSAHLSLVDDERRKSILKTAQLIDEIMKLEDKADHTVAKRCQSIFSQSRDIDTIDENAASVGMSSAPRIFNRVDLPLPGWPMMATNSPAKTSISMP